MFEIYKPCAYNLDQLIINFFSELPAHIFEADREDASGAEIINSINTQEYNEQECLSYAGIH